MSYLVLARKFRPQTFSSIIGQEHITNALATAILRNRVPHALLFTGPRGVGKTTAARVFARALNCAGRLVSNSAVTDEEQARTEVEPCGTCTNCQEIAKSTSVAVWEIDGASNNSVDNVRELIDSLRSAPPPGSRYKVYIIDEVHMLSTAAFNALLKSLEEPPPNTIFIFATTEPHKIPETVISRCQQHDFRRLSTKAIAMQLGEIAEKEGVKVADDVIDFLARRAQGGMRDAQSMFDRLLAFSKDSLDLPFVEKVFGVVDRRFFFSLAEAVHSQNTQQCFLLLDNAFRESLDVRTFLGDLLTFWRSLLVVSHCLGHGNGSEAKEEVLCRELLEIGVSEFEELKMFASKWSSFDLQRHFEIVEKTVDRALLSNYPRFVLEAGVAKMASLASLLPLAEILKSLTNGSGTYQTSVGNSVEAQKKTPQPKINHTIKQANPEALTVSATVDQPKQPVAEPKADFNPSWQDFVHHVQSRSHVVLATYLRRVSLQHFSPGDIKIKAGSFDLSGLKDSNTLQTIRDCLYSYSGVAHWNIAFSEAELSPTELPSSTVSAHDAIEGSIAQQEARAENERVVRIEKEVRSHPLVQTALSTFAGSKIEKVTVTKK